MSATGRFSLILWMVALVGPSNSFNYMVLGRTGFDVLSGVIDASDCYDFQ